MLFCSELVGRLGLTECINIRLHVHECVPMAAEVAAHGAAATIDAEESDGAVGRRGTRADTRDITGFDRGLIA
jgi:hypothetical protein